MAGTTGIIHGKRCFFQVNIGNGYQTVMCAKSFTITFETELKETTSRGSGIYKEFDYKSLSHRISLATLLKVVDLDGDPITFDLANYQKNFLELPYKAVFTDPDDNVKQVRGMLIIQNTGLNVMSGQLADGTVEFQGTGEYFIEDAAADACNNSISGVTFNGNPVADGDSLIITNSANVDIVITSLADAGIDVPRYDYELDSAGRNSAFNGSLALPFAFPTILASSITTGNHVLKIWPVCGNGFDGQVFTINILKQGPI